jgi:dihydrofolate synthase/folylpolyglutamate synthase
VTDPEAWLAGLDRLGWRFGLERIRRLTDLLGMPQRRFASIHVVGSNGKSSVAQMTAALLEEHGVVTGTYLSPHLERWSERIQLRGREIGAEPFAEAGQRVAEAAATLDRALAAAGETGPAGEPERVTQFEAATATAFQAFAAARVDVAVVEAGLGGRLDATNVIPSKVTVLASVSLEHTDLLGETEEEIAAEKLAVLRDRSTLVVGRLSESVDELAEAVARERSARLVRVGETLDAGDGDAAVAAPGVPSSVAGAYQRRNFAVAMAAASAFLDRPLDPEAVERAAAGARIPARLEQRDGDPPLILDAAHNAAGMRALAESLPELAGERRVVAVVAALADKQPSDLVAPLIPVADVMVCTEIPAAALEGVGRPGARSHPAGELRDAVRAAGGEAEAVASADQALERARELARARGGVVLATGSFYLVRLARG